MSCTLPQPVDRKRRPTDSRPSSRASGRAPSSIETARARSAFTDETAELGIAYSPGPSLIAAFMSLLRTSVLAVTPARGISLSLLLVGLSGSVSFACGGGRAAPRSATLPAAVICDYDVRVGADLALTVD